MLLLAAMTAPALFQGTLLAQAPTVLTVPATAGNQGSHHTSWSGNAVTLKGTMSSPNWGSHSFSYDWDPGDGGAHCTGTVSDPYVIECAHTYTGSVGSLFTAVLNVTDTTSSVQSGAGGNCPPAITNGTCYYTELQGPPPNLSVEVNNAIDNGLWFLHKNMVRSTHDSQIFGDWYKCDGNSADSCQIGVHTAPGALNCVAFENSGFLQTTTPANPYTEDVQRCINGLFDHLSQLAIANVTNNYGTFNPDQNSNGIAIQNNDGNEPYQLGSVIDALVGTGTPNTVIPAGSALAASGITHPGGGSYTYRDAVLDLVDFYAYCQGPVDTAGSFGGLSIGGGWQYSCQAQSDNSTNQWAAIGLIPATRVAGWSATVPSLVMQNNLHSLTKTFTQAGTLNGYFGYTSSSPIWGPYADTPSGMVQLAMHGLGRGKTITDPSGGASISEWDSAETFMRDNFGNDPNTGAGSAPKAYIYGLLSFTKSMLLHSNDGTGTTASPITNLHSSDDPSKTDIDWYAAQTSAFGGSDPTDGVARYLIGIQQSNGSWFGQNYDNSQNYLETGMAITMLRRTVFKPVPTACAQSKPQPIANGGTITLDGSCSTPGNFPISSWKWDISGTAGTNFNPNTLTCLVPTTCVKASFHVSAPPGSTFPYNYPVRLRITDTDNPAVTADVTFNIVIGSPPNPPSANAGGPYNFCPAKNLAGNYIYAPFKLDGSHSTNPDDGQTDGTPGAPPSMITAFDWDFNCANAWNSASGSQPDVTTAFGALAGSTFNVCLRVTNNDNLAFPTAGLPSGLTSTSSAQVTVNSTTDPNCTHCVSTLTAIVKTPAPGVPGNIQLYWTDTNSPSFPIDHYNVYRSTNANFTTFVELAGALSNPHINPIPVPAVQGSKLNFTDTTIAPGTTYYYRIAPATANDTETCATPPTLQVSVGACPRCR